MPKLWTIPLLSRSTNSWSLSMVPQREIRGKAPQPLWSVTGMVTYFLKMASRIGIATNNEAEYWALLLALDFLRQWKVKRLSVFSDSELLVRQLQGTYRVRSPRLSSLHQLVKERIQGFPSFTITHIPREKNRRADSLASEILTSRVRL